MGIYEKVGWKLGAWRDVGWWQLELKPRTGEPPPPRALEDVRRDPEFARILAASGQPPAS